MEVTSWCNGNPNRETGSGFGLKIRIADRDEHFSQDWREVHLLLEGKKVTLLVSIDNESFWEDCSELRSQGIGEWFLQHGLAYWPKGHPHKLTLTPVANNHFKLTLPNGM